jgi:hypothetical protein
VLTRSVEAAPVIGRELSEEKGEAAGVFPDDEHIASEQGVSVCFIWQLG